MVKLKQRSEHTLRNYTNDLPLLVDLADVEVRTLRSDDIVGWYEAISRRLPPARAYCAYVTLRSLLSYARRRGVVTANVASCLGITYDPAPARPLLPEDMAAWKDAYDAAWARRVGYVSMLRNASDAARVGLLSSLLVVEFLRLTGRRLSEGCGVEVENVRLAQRHILLPVTKTGASSIPLAPESVRFVGEQLERLAGRSVYLFPSVTWAQHITPRTVWEVFHQLRAAAGLPADVNPHDLRHGWICTALASGVSFEAVSEGCGHRNAATTKRHYAKGLVITPTMLATAEVVERAQRSGVSLAGAMAPGAPSDVARQLQPTHRGGAS